MQTRIKPGRGIMPRPWLFVGRAPALAEGYLLDQLARDRTEMAHGIAHRDDREALRIGWQPQRVVDFLLVKQVARGESSTQSEGARREQDVLHGGIDRRARHFCEADRF